MRPLLIKGNFAIYIPLLLLTVSVLKAEDLGAGWFGSLGTYGITGSYDIDGANDMDLRGYGLNANIGKQLSKHLLASLSFLPQRMEIESNESSNTDIESFTTVGVFSTSKYMPIILYFGGAYTDGKSDYSRQQGGPISGSEDTTDWSFFGDASYLYYYEDWTIIPSINLAYRKSQVGGFQCNRKPGL